MKPSLPFLILLFSVPAVAAPGFDITITSRYNTQVRQARNLREFFAAHPGTHLKQWDGISLQQAGMQASLAMAMAANIGPDIFETDIRQAVSQGLAYPLTEWIGEDGVLANGKPKLKPDGSRDLNGKIDADEAKWPGWMQLTPLYRQVVTVDGKPYALPHAGGTYVGILYSKRLIRKAGLDPAHPPRTWDEFARWCRKLYDPKTHTFGAEIYPASWNFAPWIATTGSSIVVQDRKSPRTGKIYTFNEQDTNFRAPDTGEDLSTAAPTWRCNVASPECTAAIGFYHRLRWTPWVKDPDSREPIELTPQQRAAGVVSFAGRTVRFHPADVVEGSIGVTLNSDIMQTLRRIGRDLAIYPLWAGDMTEFEQQGIQPDDLGMFPFPAMTSRQKPVLQASNYFFMIGKDVLHRGGGSPADRKKYRDLVWGVLSRICSVEGGDEEIRQKVAAGEARFLNPRDLQRLGFEDYLREMPPENRQLWKDIDAGRIREVIEPYMGKWLQFRDFYQREAIELVLHPSGKEFDYRAALKHLEHDANTGIMFERPSSELDAYRPLARAIAGIVGFVLLIVLGFFIRSRRRRAVSHVGVFQGWLPWALLFPALASITLWGYYPLVRGLVMAFQDYKIVGHSPFVGLGNFISIALDPNFYHYVITTFRFVLWNLALAFFAPILLAFMVIDKRESGRARVVMNYGGRADGRDPVWNT